MTTQTAYTAIRHELEAIEVAYDLYLTDENVDHENTYETFSRDEPGYWGMMIASMTMSAGARAEEAGLNINNLLGRVIY